MRENLRRFLNDESGGYTIWSLFWFMIYLAVGGIAVDGTDAYNKQMLLQATADSSALAGAMSLPDEGEAVDMALAYAVENLSTSVHGVVLKEGDINIGYWDFDTASLTVGGGTPNAVHVITRRSRENSNPVAMNLLRILQLFGLEPLWDVVTEAVAVRYQPKCLLGDSLFAGNEVYINPNGLFKNVCIHGQNLIEDNGIHDYGVDIAPNTEFDNTIDIGVPTPADKDGSVFACTKVDGYCEGIVYGDLMPLEAYSVLGRMTAMEGAITAAQSASLPEGEELSVEQGVINLSTDCTGDPCRQALDEFDQPIEGVYEYTAVMDSGDYRIKCSEEEQLILPGPEIQEAITGVNLLSDCKIMGQSDMKIEDTTLASMAQLGTSPDNPYEKSTIQFPSNVSFGAPDCIPGEGDVTILSYSSIKVAAAGVMRGVKMIARGDIELTANQSAAQVSLWAGENVRMTANADWGTACGEGANTDVVWRVRLVW